MIKTIRLLLTFYKSFAVASFAITFACLFLMFGFKANGIYMIQVLFWFKIATLALIVYSVNSYKSKEFYYYKNHGLSNRKLWLPILVFDFLVFLISIITIASKLHEALSGS